MAEASVCDGFLPLARQIAPKVSNPKHTTSLGETILICGNANSSAARRKWRKGIFADDYQILEVRTAIFVLDQGPIYRAFRLLDKRSVFLHRCVLRREDDMSSITISFIVFACVFGGALLGILLRVVLPQNHLSAESKDIVKLGMGLVGTMAALVLGLLVASAKGSYDAQIAELTQASTNILLLDRLLAQYGPETKEERALLRGTVVRFLDQIWSKGGASASGLPAPSASAETLYGQIQGLSPKDGAQRSFQSQALSIVMDLRKTRWLVYEQETESVSLPLLVILVLWLTIIFISFGLFAPFNATVVSSLTAAALSVSAAIFLILDMYRPYSGLIQISSAPLRFALAHLGQ